MRLRDKFLCTLLVISLLLSMSFPVWADAEKSEGQAKTQILFFEDFESYSTGATGLSGYAGSAKTNSWSVSADSDGKKHFRMRVTTTSDMHLDRNFAEGSVAEDFIVTMDVMFEDYNDVVKAVFLKSTSGAEVGVVRFLPSGALTLADGTVIANYATGKFYNLAIGVNLSKNTANVYFNGKKRAADVSLGAKAFTDLIMVRVHMREVKANSNMRLDNLGVYTGTKVMDAETLEAYLNGGAGSENSETESETTASANLTISGTMGNSIGLHNGNSNALIKGVKSKISEDKSVTPFIDNDIMMVPLKFFAESLGGTVTWDGATSSLVMKYKDITVTMRAGEAAIDINGKSITLAKAPMLKGGSSYIPIVDFCELLELYCFSDVSDLIIYGERQLNLTWTKDGALLRKIAESFVYNDVDGAEIIRRIKEKHPNQGHPRLIMTQEKFDAIRANLASDNPDKVYVELKEKILSKANSYLPTKSVHYELRDGVRMINVSRDVKNRVMDLAMAYQLTFDDRYAERAWLEMYTAACFSDWHPWHFLDVAEMTIGLAFGYDWLYHWLDEGQRKIIREAMVEHAFYQVANDYSGAAVPGKDHTNLLHRSWNWRGGNPINNWLLICSGGMSTGVIAVCDEMSGNDLSLCEQILSQCLRDIRPVLSLFAPAGSYPEGINYWGFTTEFLSYYMGSLRSAAGEDFGYTNAPGLRHTTDFILALNGTTSNFNFGDALPGSTRIEWPMMFFGSIFNDSAAVQARVDKIFQNDGVVQDFFFYDSALSADSGAGNSSLDTYLRDSEVYSTRSGYDKDAIWTAIHFGDNFADHGQYDMGTFVMDAMGENFFMDTGSSNYNLPNRFTDAYRSRAEGNNTIVINPELGPGQVFQSTALIDKHESKPQGAYAISDMTTAYSTWADRMRRGIKLDNYRRMVTLQDEVRLKEISDFWWFAHTKAEIEVSEDGKRAYLSLRGKTLLAEIISGEGAVFSVMDAKPMESSPKLAGQNSNAGVRKLTIHIPECKDLDLAVTFKKYDKDYFAEDYNNTFVPLDEWSIPDGECVIPYAQVNSISVNGKEIEGFDPNVYTYEIQANSADYLWGNRVITATADGEVIVKESDSWGNTVYVTAMGGNGKNSKGYELKFVTPPTAQEPTDKQMIKPVSVKASDVPQPENSPENTLDGNMETRWSCAGICWIEYDLGSIYELNSVSLAFWLASERLGQLDIEISQDGQNYVKCFDGDALKRDGFENHKLFGLKARYVRINCFGYDNDTSKWNSLLEAKFYKE